MAELMKGHVWKDHKHKVKYPCYVEVKHDEIRVHVKVVGPPTTRTPCVVFISYAGKPLHNLARYTEGFLRLHRASGYTEFDCGFECNGNFNDSYRWVRSNEPPADLLEAPHRLFLFDLPENVEEYNTRAATIHCVAGLGRHASLPMFGVEAHFAHDEEEVHRIYARFRTLGYEGAMVKDYHHLYQRKRTRDWLKLKPEEDASGVIEEINMAYCGVDQPELGLVAGDPLGRAGSVRIRLTDGSVAEPHGIAHDTGRDMVENPHLYIGETCDFKYMERDRQGGYRHPTFLRVREAT